MEKKSRCQLGIEVGGGSDGLVADEVLADVGGRLVIEEGAIYEESWRGRSGRIG